MERKEERMKQWQQRKMETNGWHREREQGINKEQNGGEWQRGREWQWERERESMCVCMRVCVCAGVCEGVSVCTRVNLFQQSLWGRKSKTTEGRKKGWLQNSFILLLDFKVPVSTSVPLLLDDNLEQNKLQFPFSFLQPVEVNFIKGEMQSRVYRT